MINRIKIEGYKSFKKIDLELKPINILIGANGSGKSNFLTFFEFLNQLYNQNLNFYLKMRGFEKTFHKGLKETTQIDSKISFNKNKNSYSFSLNVSDDRSIIFNRETLWYRNDPFEIGSYEQESKIKNNHIGRGDYINEFLNKIKKYHFHDTSRNSPFTKECHCINDAYSLYEDGRNIAAILYRLSKEKVCIYEQVVEIIQIIAPYFLDFVFEVNEESQTLRLLWKSKHSSTIYGATDLSDGTIRFIALVVLFLQPVLPDTIIIDEPELGLHPAAIALLAELIESVSRDGKHQVLIATQSVELLNEFTAESIITVDQIDGESQFKRLDEEELKHWLENYSIGELWQMNIIKGGQPNE